jgi:hypothetical protein
MATLPDLTKLQLDIPDPNITVPEVRRQCYQEICDSISSWSPIIRNLFFHREFRQQYARDPAPRFDRFFKSFAATYTGEPREHLNRVQLVLALRKVSRQLTDLSLWMGGFGTLFFDSPDEDGEEAKQ